MRKILLIVVATVFLAVFYFVGKNNHPVNAGFGTPTPTPDLTNCKVKTYQDKFVEAGFAPSCIDKIRIKGILFVPKDQTAGVKSYWSANMIDVFNKIKTFYEGQFNNLINISYETPVTVYGDKNILEYNGEGVLAEAKAKANFVSNEYYVVYMIYVVTGVDGKYISAGLGGWTHQAIQGAFWLDPESLGSITNQYGTDYSGYKGSAHEFGHTLSIPHPWEEEQNKDSNGTIINQSYGNDEAGSLMSYGGQRWPDAFIRQTVKNRMIISVVQTATPSPTSTPTPSRTPTPTPTPTLSPTPTPTPSPTCYSWMPCWASPTPTPITTPTPSPSRTPTPTPTPTPAPITSRVQAVRFIGDTKVYVVQGSVIKWVPDLNVFNNLNLNWASVEVIPPNQKTNFQRAKLLRAENDQKVYYVTESGLKRHIPNIETFNSYGNQWQDVVVVKDFELSAIADNQLIRQTGDSKVYKLENGQKRWIKTAEAFNRLGLNWAQIAPVNSVEINSYTEGGVIE